MVGNGVLVTGDAACLVNPIHGGGIGPSMMSGHLAGKTIIEALEKGDVSQESLWPYSLRYNAAYGAKQARLDIFRMILLSCRDEDLNYGMRYHLLTEEDVLKAGMGDEFHLNITETSRRVFRGLKRIGFLNKLRLTVKYMNQVKAHYEEYPETPKDFEKWHVRTGALFREAASKIMK
jgi:flavin-dependent dehydrogenase